MTLLIYFLGYFFFAFFLRSWLTFRRTGINPMVLPHRDDAYGFVGTAFRIVVACVALFIIIHAWQPEWLTHTGAIEVLQLPMLETIGWVLLLASLLWIVIAQWQMGASWRIGIDEKNRTALISHGLFGRSRNPIFLAMRVNLLGLFLLVPHAGTLALLIAGDVLMQLQVRLEEAHLRALHGAEYAAYEQRVRRWL